MAATMHDLLTIMIERNASDVHVTTGTYPQIRLNGKLIPLSQFEVLTPQDTQRLAYSVLNEGQKITVISDKALARTYVRLNAILDGINSSMFFGEPFSMSVRDDVSEQEERALLQGPGVIYLREDEVKK